MDKRSPVVGLSPSVSSESGSASYARNYTRYNGGAAAPGSGRRLRAPSPYADSDSDVAPASPAAPAFSLHAPSGLSEDSSGDSDAATGAAAASRRRRSGTAALLAAARPPAAAEVELAEVTARMDQALQVGGCVGGWSACEGRAAPAPCRCGRSCAPDTTALI
jgi:hypothetical protein